MKGTTYKKPTLFAATRTLKRFFSEHPESNTVTKEDMLASWERNKPEFEKTNEGWLSGKLTALYSHSLVKPVYSYSPWKKLEHIELTAKGKVALGREDAPVNISTETVPDPVTKAVNDPRDLTIDDILMALPNINERLSTHRVRIVFEDKEAKPIKESG